MSDTRYDALLKAVEEFANHVADVRQHTVEWNLGHRDDPPNHGGLYSAPAVRHEAERLVLRARVELMETLWPEKTSTSMSELAQRFVEVQAAAKRSLAALEAPAPERGART